MKHFALKKAQEAEVARRPQEDQLAGKVLRRRLAHQKKMCVGKS